MTLTMESCLELGITGCITIIVVNRSSIIEYNKTVADWGAYILCCIVLFSLIAAPFYLLRASYRVHNFAKEEVKRQEQE